MTKQTIREHFTALKVGAPVCKASGRVVENLETNGQMVECPSCRRIVKTKEVK